MRAENYGIVKGASGMFTKEETLELFTKMCAIRYFEEEVKKSYDAGLMYMPVYLSLGQEAIAAALSVALKNKKPSIFAQHRAHGTYIAFGGDLKKLVDELLHRETGCAGGMGGSASIHSPEIRMMGHDGLMGTQVPIGVGYSFAKNYKSQNKDYSLIIMGDASAEEDYVLGALGYAAHKKLPIIFVCEDNNLSILTEVKVRRNWKMTDVAKSFGMQSAELADDPWSIMYNVKRVMQSLPAFLNIHTTRAVWHAGTGQDAPPEWDRFSLIKEEIERIGFVQEVKEIEEKTKEEMQKLWEMQLAVK